MDNRLIEIAEYRGDGYRSLVEYEGWRVAVLNHIEKLRPENLRTMQAHTESDEVFVLLAGRFVLFTGGAGDAPGDVDGVLLEPGKVYNVKKGVWHTHTLTEGSSALIVENRDTDRHGDSPTLPITQEQREKLLRLARELA